MFGFGKKKENNTPANVDTGADLTARQEEEVNFLVKNKKR